MTFFVDYSLYQYDGDGREKFATIEEVLAFLNKHAANPDFTFSVIEGHEVHFKPIEVVKGY